MHPGLKSAWRWPQSSKPTAAIHLNRLPRRSCRRSSAISTFLRKLTLHARQNAPLCDHTSHRQDAPRAHWGGVNAEVDGTPMPSMFNARLCLNALDIACSYDTFHHKTIFGYRGDTVQHELEPIVGEVSDDAVIRLRQIISERFGFDPGDTYTSDAIKSLALEHCFDPVRDLLDKAEREWDGVKRIDRFAADYLNTDDTSLNAAFGRKTLLAAVRRARRPGCKKDEITVLESEEGWNKSSAIRALAGDENFSDQSILGQAGREVQEQLGGVWMHENPELAGLSKAHVEDVKAFASRQVDIARKAYGRHITKQPRHSIEWGTTNNSEYLQSQNGNRRFWCMAVRRAIDLEKIKRDRLQLLGEAAHYESKGESLTLDEKLWPDARAAQEQRRIQHPWEDILSDISADHIRSTTDTNGNPAEFVSSADLLTNVLHITRDKLTDTHGKLVARVMTRLGWQRASRRIDNKPQARGYMRSVALIDGRGPLVQEGGSDGIPF